MPALISPEERIGVIGAGSWGTTLANLLSNKGFKVELWVFEEELFRILKKNRENEFYLPGIRLPDSLQFTPIIEEAFAGKTVLICAVPSHTVRNIFSQGSYTLPQDVLIVSVTKGLEDGTHLSATQVLWEIVGQEFKGEITCLSGPSFAKEVCREIPTAVTAAGRNLEATRKTQALFTTPFLRVYTNPDWLGVELGGAIKNVMAIAAGASDGLGFGHSSRAALITRGLAEMTRLGVKMGADERTFFGLSGLGDLVLTCTGDLSRNRQVGLALGRGQTLVQILEGTKMVAEGIRTTQALFFLTRKLKVEMPITEKVYEILYQKKEPRQAVGELMSRNPRSEREGS